MLERTSQDAGELFGQIAGRPPGWPRRVAIVHYWFVTMRGGERVVERLLHLFPHAEIFTHVFVPEAVSDVIRARPVHTSFIQRLPGARRHYQKYLPLMPMALEHLDLRGFDLVISSEAGPAKGVITDPETVHLCYAHSPMRYVWDQFHQYRESAGPVTRAAMSLLFGSLRNWDVTSAARIDTVIANSTFVRKRIAKTWGRDSIVVHPPVDTSLFKASASVGAEYLWVGQMTPYKRADLAVEAFNRLGLPLLMVGDGEMAADLRKRAGPNIRMVERMKFDELRAAYADSRALLFTAKEDFGIVPVEMMASGRPVLAFGGGGARDTVADGVTGLFFDEQTVESVIGGVEAMEAWLPGFRPTDAQHHASRFSPERFDAGILAALAG